MSRASELEKERAEKEESEKLAKEAEESAEKAEELAEPAEKVGEEETPAGEGEEPVKEPTEDEVFEAEVKKRGAKNIILENKRKSDELALAKQELENFKTLSQAKEIPAKPAEEPEEIKQYREEMVAEGYDEKFINRQVNLMLKIALGTANYRLQPTEKFIYKDEAKKELSKLKKVPKYKVVLDKYEGEVLEQLEIQKVAPKYWGDEGVLKALIGQITLDHSDELFGQSGKTRIVKEVPTEGSGASGGGKGELGISDAELKDFADKNDLDISTSENRLKAKKAYAIRKRALSQLNKEE